MKGIDQTNIMVEFVVIGDEFPLDTVTERLGVKPSNMYMKGDHRKETAWCISTGYENSLDVGEQLNKLISILDHKQQVLNQLKEEYDLDYKFFIVVKIEQNQSPGVYFDKRIIKFAHDIQAEFDIDLYVY